MTKKNEEIDYNDIYKNPYYRARKKPLITKINRIIGVCSFIFFVFYIFYQIENTEAERSAFGLVGNVIFLVYFFLTSRTLLRKSVVARFIVSGIITAFYTFNLCGIFGVRYPVFYNLLKNSVLFCYGLPIVMMIISIFLPLNQKVRFYLGTAMGATGLVIFAMVQTFIEHHNLFIFSFERMHTAFAYSWIALVLGVVMVFKSSFDVKYYDAYKEHLRPKSDGGYVSYVENKNGDLVDAYYYNRADSKMQGDWDDGKYRNAQDFVDDYHDTYGE